MWKDGYPTFRRWWHESARESAIYHKLKKGLEFEGAVEYPIPRKPLVEEIKLFITPAEETGHYPLIIGEHGTGKTSLIELAVNDMDKNKPKGVVYVNIPDRCALEDSVVEATREALGWGPDQVIDSDKRKYSNSFQ
jgi:ABC-type molybdenum transport system ATPase subunit/photorepair protein PhrA